MRPNKVIRGIPMVEHVKSGIEGLDALVDGGFPKGHNVLITGGPGTGKSIIALQYLVSGAMNGEPGVYLTCDETKDKIISQALIFGWDLSKLEKENKIILKSLEEEFDIEAILETMQNDVKKIKAKRVVIDSISMLGIYSKVVPEIFKKTVKKLPRFQRHIEEMQRPQIVAIFQALASFGTTNLVIAEGDEQSAIPEYAADGVIQVKRESVGSSEERSLEVVKMRETKTNGGTYSFVITETGVRITK
jgi:KaiC/GvpD/RAD55 family RecA-like ATPase